jgi:hypothetical protein
MSIRYHIYANSGIGDAVDYSTPIGDTATTTFSPPALTVPGDYTFAVRPYDTVSGLEDQNVDARVRIVTDAAGVDVTGRPNPPTGLTARATAGGTAALGWTYNPLGEPGTPTHFHVYRGIGAVDYTTPIATIDYSPALRSYRATISGLAHGTTYLIGVRAFNATSEEPNTVTVVVTGDTTGPDAVDDLGATVV